MTQAVAAALREEAGSLLVFLPGVAEIRALEDALQALPRVPTRLGALMLLHQANGALSAALAEDATPAVATSIANAQADRNLINSLPYSIGPADQGQ